MTALSTSFPSCLSLFPLSPAQNFVLTQIIALAASPPYSKLPRTGAMLPAFPPPFTFLCPPCGGFRPTSHRNCPCEDLGAPNCSIQALSPYLTGFSLLSADYSLLETLHIPGFPCQHRLQVLFPYLSAFSFAFVSFSFSLPTLKWGRGSLS